MIGRRRQRDWDSLINDPQTPFMFGRLLGANELAIALLSQSGESDNARHIAEVLTRQGAWFFIDPPDMPSSAVTGTMRTLGMGEP